MIKPRPTRPEEGPDKDPPAPGEGDVVTVHVSDDGGEWREIHYADGRHWKAGTWLTHAPKS